MSIMPKEWEGFTGGSWTKTIDVRGFIQKNYTPYEGDESFLVGPTETTKKLWNEVLDLFQKERENGGVLDMAARLGCRTVDAKQYNALARKYFSFGYGLGRDPLLYSDFLDAIGQA